MKNANTLLLAFLTLISVSCTKSQNVTGDYIVVGIAGGFVPQLDFYLINNGQLKHDTTHRKQPIPDDLTKLQFDVMMPDARYQKVAHLRESIPSSLLSQNNKTFGEQGYDDAATVEVQTTINGTQYHWYFTGDLSNCSKAIEKFALDANKVFN